MFRFFRWLKSAGRPRAAAGKHSRQHRPRGFLPRLEILEDRTVPSTLTVTSNLDSGAGSLRGTIATAHNGDTIVFAPSIHLITLTSGELVVNKNLSITGSSADTPTISGNDASRVFHIVSGSTVTLTNLTITDGQFSGSLPASVVGVYSGAGTGAGGGGGIFNEAGAHLTLTNDTVSGNQAVHGSSPLAFTVLGGGLLNLGTATVQGCAFSNNEAEGGNGLDAIGGSAGGAIDNFGGPTGGATLTVTNSTFSGNSAVSSGGNFYFGIGGALESDAGLNGFDPTQAMPSTVTMTNCNVVNNLATGGPNALTDGGGLCTEGDGVLMTLIGCTINDNRAEGGGGGDGITTGDSEGVGGGIEAGGTGTLNIVGCTITSNQALGGNNTILSNGDTLAGAAFGGGIENNSPSTLNISNSLIANNTAQGGSMTTNPGPGSDALGGGISNSPGATMVMTNCLVANNNASAGQGGAGVNTALTIAPGGLAFGGGVDTSRGSTATVSGSTITGNSAVGSAGGAGNNGGNGYGGGLGVGWGNLLGFSPDVSQLTLSDTVVSNNHALGGTGGAGASSGTALGGGLALTSGCTATVNNGTINNNVANGSVSPGQANGGGGIDNAGTLYLSQSTLQGNQALTTAGSDVLGGGLLNNEGTATVSNTTFNGNQALGGGSSSFFGGSAGGAIDNYEGATLVISGSTFQNNQAISAADVPNTSYTFDFATGGAIESDAGIVNNKASTVTISNSTFTNNLVTGGFGVIGNGGGIDNQANIPGLANMTLVDCTISGNRSLGGGGGDGITIGDSNGIGGGMMNVQATMTVVGCSVTNNQAIAGNNAILSATNPIGGTAFGGGIENTEDCTLIISNSTVSNNTAQGGANLTGVGPGGDGLGGGIGNTVTATMMMTNCIVSNNSAIGGHGAPGVNPLLAGLPGGLGFGGGIDNSNMDCSATISDSTITNNRAIGGAGGNGNNGGNGDGGGLGVGWGTLVGFSPDGSQLTVIDSVVANNQALGGAGGAGANGGNGLGGGLFVTASCSATVTVCTIDNNQAIGGQAGHGGSDGQGIGGGVYNDLGTFDDVLSAIANNHASTSHDNVFP